MVACKTVFNMINGKHDVINQRGAGMVEILLVLTIIAAMTPFIYSQIMETNHMIYNVSVARDIIGVRNDVLNFVRMNQENWPETVQIVLSPDELKSVSSFASVGIIDRYSKTGVTITDVYLGFDLDMEQVRIAKIAKNIGGNAAIVGADGIAYGDNWAVQAPELKPGFLVYKISRDVSNIDVAKYLHRTSSGDDGLNVMQRDLDMNRNDLFDVGDIGAKSVKVRNINAVFVDASDVRAKDVYFSAGANMDGENVNMGNLRVTNDISGFRNITANKLNGDGYSLNGRIIADKAIVNKSINVGRNLTIKSDSTKTISAFSGISAGTVSASHISATDVVFFEDFGLTVSGELMVSTTAPIQFGNWVFPSKNPPSFAELTLGRAKIPTVPNADEFDKLIKSGWKQVK